MKLEGKNVYFLGDSITAGAGASEEKNRFVNVFATLSGANVYNYGVGGTRIGVQKFPTLNFPEYDENFLIRAKKIGENADMVVVFGGTNDWGHGDIPIGDSADCDETTFSGCLNLLCKYLSDRFGKEKLLFLTPLRRFGEENIYGEGKKVVPSRPLCDYVTQIKEIVSSYKIDILDLYQSGLPKPEIKGLSEYSFDGTHPNDKGHYIIAKTIYDYLLSK